MLGGAVVRRAVAVVEFIFCVVGLAANAVEPLIGVGVDVAVVVHLLHQRLNRCVVPWLGRADEIVVGDLQQRGGFTEQDACRVDLLLRADAVGLGGPLDLETVLVGAGKHHGVVAQEAMPAGERISIDGGVGVTDVWCVVDVVDRRGDVVRAHLAKLTALQDE